MVMSKENKAITAARMELWGRVGGRMGVWGVI